MDLKKLKEELRPDISIMNEINCVINDINLKLKKNRLKATCVPGGSVAKGTFLKGDFDVDLFVKFDKSYNDKNLSDLLEQSLDFQKERVHGSRDYFQFKDGKLNYEVVPVLDITDPNDSENVTDMSPMHVDWVLKRIKKGTQDDIRLAKKFCKSIGCYGAESHISGFSGHVIDILVIHYGTFEKLLAESKNWKPKVIIDVMKHYKNKQELLFTLNKSKTEGPMILIDPILKTRNAASALSFEKLEIFRKAASKFLKKPGNEFFEEKIIDEAYLKKLYKKNLFIVNVNVEAGKKDVVGSRILKAHSFLKSEMGKKGFVIDADGWYWDNKRSALIWVVLKNSKLPEKKIINGPPIEMKDACKKFKAIYKKTFEKKKKLLAEIKIEKREALDNLKKICKQQYFLNKVTLKNIDPGK